VSISRGNLRLRAGTLLDAVYNGAMHPRYSDVNWLNETLGLVHMEEWKKVLTAGPYYQVDDITAATDANGFVNISALDSGVDDSRHHAHRALEVAQNGQPFSFVEPRDYPFAAAENSYARVWLVRGRQLQVPAVRSGSITVLTNFYPCRADLLQSDDSVVEFIDGYELLLAYMLAARMGGKGAEEAGAAAYLKQEAAEIREPMLLDMRRFAARPTAFQAQDDVSDWEGGW
jgi:hypothetical protein